MRKTTNTIIINGLAVPAPDQGFTISESIFGNFKRNGNNAVVGNVVGRPLYKISNLQWSSLEPSEWIALKNALRPFFVNVTFTTDENERKTIMMYPSDKSANPMHVNATSNEYGSFKTCKFNLTDCGY